VDEVRGEARVTVGRRVIEPDVVRPSSVSANAGPQMHPLRASSDTPTRVLERNGERYPPPQSCQTCPAPDAEGGVVFLGQRGLRGTNKMNPSLG
jgi:hypothetical protein